MINIMLISAMILMFLILFYVMSISIVNAVRLSKSKIVESRDIQMVVVEKKSTLGKYGQDKYVYLKALNDNSREIKVVDNKLYYEVEVDDVIKMKEVFLEYNGEICSVVRFDENSDYRGVVNQEEIILKR